MQLFERVQHLQLACNCDNKSIECVQTTSVLKAGLTMY